MFSEKYKMTETQKFKHIVRIANVDIPGEKQLFISLLKIKGVGTNFASVICTLSDINKTMKTGELSDAQILKITEVLTKPIENGLPVWMVNRRKDFETGEDQHLLSGNLHFVKENDLKRLKKTKTLRGMRHQKKLPVRGQRTRSNFRRHKGKVVGVKRKGTPGKK